MPLTELDPVTALIVVDLQKGLTAHPYLQPFSAVVENTCSLLRTFRALSLPVGLVNVAGRAPGRTEQGPRSSTSFADGWTELLPELEHRPEDIVVTKRSWGAFATTDLEEQLRNRAVTQVVIAGVVTSGGVEATARQAYEQGFNVTLALDAMTDVHEEAQNYSVGKVFPRIGETGTTEAIITLLQKRSAYR